MDSSWEANWSLFHQALELDAAARANWLRRLAETAPGQAAEIAALLDAHERADGVLDRPLIQVDEIPGLRPGDRVGVYLLLREIGHGGMGAVYEAERDDGEYRHRVALKLVAPERLRPAALVRFRRERQIMAGLQHPNIARLLDGGTTAQGWPYLVMEYIEGAPIDVWCRQHGLPLAARLQMIEQLAGAIDHAHRHLIVHRDIKPGNVLVNAEGQPVLLDFGIAKWIDSEASAADATIQIGQAAMTPRYASPEQLRGQAVSTATDIYALGVLLYELIAGASPHAPSQESPERLAERIEQEAPLPLAVAARRHALAAAAQSEPAPADASVRFAAEAIPDELDWIVRRAMAAHPDQRYPNALALADDLRRLRLHQPVQARPPTLRYRFGKSLRRYWLGYSVAAGVLLLLAGFALRLGIESQRTRAALSASLEQRAQADRVAGFLAGMFELADRTQAEGRDVSAREMLDQGRERLAGERQMLPAVRARLLISLARVYRNLGAYPVALHLLEESAQLIDPAAEPLLHAERLRDLGNVLELQGSNAAARDALQASLRAFEQLGPAQSLEAARTTKLLAGSLQSLGERAQAGVMFRRADTALNGHPAASIDDRADCALRLGSWYWVAGDFDESTRYYARALRLRRTEQPPDLPELARTLDAHGVLAHAMGRYGEAQKLIEEGLAIRRQVLGVGHRLSADSLSNLGAVFIDQGAPEQALPHLLEAREIFERVLPADSPILAKTLNNLGLVRQSQRDFAEARRLFQRALDIHRHALGDQHPKLAANLNNLGLVEEQSGDYAAAMERFEEALRLQKHALGPDHVNIGFTLTNLGRLAIWKGDRMRALQYLQSAQETRAQLPAAHPLRSDTQVWLGLALCLGADDRARGLALIETALRGYSEAQALSRIELEALAAYCSAPAQQHAGEWRTHIAAVAKLRGTEHPLSRFLRTQSAVGPPRASHESTPNPSKQ